MTGNPSLECRIASLVHAHFEALPQRSKPTIHENGLKEWIPLCGIVLVSDEDSPNEELTCVAVATGAKCLSSSQIPQCNGLVLHDSHAEILALRAFNHWLLEECKFALTHCKDMHAEGTCINPSCRRPSDHGALPTCSGSRFLQWNRQNPRSTEDNSTQDGKNFFSPPFQISEGLRIWMYCTCAPCGDASMELCMAAQEDATPWEIPSPDQKDLEGSVIPPQKLLDGRAHFSILGAVRRKPSRADAESTLSKSCSDKLALKQVTSILSFSTSLLVAPTAGAYISNIILPEDELNRVGCNRAFGDGETGRMRALNGRVWATTSNCEGFQFRPFAVNSLPIDAFKAMWRYRKPDNKSSGGRVKTGNVSAVWTASQSYSSQPPYSIKGHRQLSNSLETKWHQPSFKTAPTNVSETLINGVKQGYRLNSPGFKKASALSRASMWALLCDNFELLSGKHIAISWPPPDNTTAPLITRHVFSSPTYDSLKSPSVMTGTQLARYQALNDARLVLQSWIRNEGDGNWGLNVFDVLTKESVKGSPASRKN